MERRPFLLHALSPLHAGTGHSADVIDLPIARMRATGIPIVPGSSIKGVMRDASPRNDETTFAVFGPETEKAADHAGALTVSDARLLALPVRSFAGTFAWVTSPLLLSLTRRDCPDMPALSNSPSAAEALVTHGTTCIQRHNGADKVFLEDLDLMARKDATEAGEVTTLAKYIAGLTWSQAPDVLTKRFIVVDDETMTFLWETATQLDTRIRIDSSTKTVADGALWVEESLPPETLLIGVLEGDKSRRMKKASGDPLAPMRPSEVLDHALPSAGRILQFGGKATVGRGRCSMIRIDTAKGDGNGRE